MKKSLIAAYAFALTACWKEPVVQTAQTEPVMATETVDEGVPYTVVGMPQKVSENVVSLRLRQEQSWPITVDVSYCVGADAEKQKSLEYILQLRDGQKIGLRHEVEHGVNTCSSNFY